MRDPVLQQETWYIPTVLDYVRWGRLPTQTARAIVTVPSGSLVTFDVVSHEGILEDQGRDPVRFFGQYGIPAGEVLRDAIAVARSSIPHDFVHDGPHVISPPVAVAGAEPGDILRVEIVALRPRVPYGVTSIRHGKGTLPERFPGTAPPAPDASAARPDAFHNVFFVVPIRATRAGWVATFRSSGRSESFPIHPFLGTMGVAVDTTAPPSSVPPGRYAGNLDLRHLTVGSTLYIPVQVPGARFYVADSHFNQGNGEVDLTAIEGSLRATVRLTVIKRGARDAPFRGRLTEPFAETPDYWIPMGLSPDLDTASRRAIDNAIEFLTDRFGMTPIEAYAYLSISTDFDITELVDSTKGVHALIRKRDFGLAPTEPRDTTGAGRR